MQFKSNLQWQKNVQASRKNIIYVKNILFGILLHVVENMESISYLSIIDNSGITYDEIINTEANLYSKEASSSNKF